MVLALVAAVVSSVLVSPSGRAAAQPSSSPKVDCVDVQPDAAKASAMLATCARPVEILSERTEYSQTFLNPDGSRTLEQGIEPVRVRKGSSWAPVDTTLKPADGGYAPRASVLPMVFSAGGSGPFARLRDGDRELAMSWPERLPAPELDGSSLVYREVLPATDLRVTATALGFSEVLVVGTREAAQNPKLAELRFGLTTKNLEVVPAAGGGLTARDKAGEAIFAAPAPVMWDSSAEAGQQDSPAAGAKDAPDPTAQRKTEKAETEVAAEKPALAPADPVHRAVMPLRVEGEQLTIVPDRKMLADDRTKFPVFIDPSWTGGIASNAWTSVWSKHKTSSFWQNASALQGGSTSGSAGAGRTEDCNGCADYVVRSLFRMNTSTVRGKHILDAKFRIEQRHAWTCSPKSNAKLWLTGAISSGTTWNNQPTWDSSRTAQTAANRKRGAAHGCAGTERSSSTLRRW